MEQSALANEAMLWTDAGMLAALESASPEELDALEFGVVGMDATGVVVLYNRCEVALSGLSAAGVLGRNFFTAVAPCTNNYLVAQRFRDEPTLDAELDYVFTLKMRPTKVRLRLLQTPEARRKYLLVARR